MVNCGMKIYPVNSQNGLVIYADKKKKYEGHLWFSFNLKFSSTEFLRCLFLLQKKQGQVKAKQNALIFCSLTGH